MKDGRSYQCMTHSSNRLPPSHGRPFMDGKLYLLHHQLLIVNVGRCDHFFFIKFV